MKYAPILVSIFLASLIYPLNAADKSVPQSGELKNIVIEGVPRIQMKGDKPMDVPVLDPQKPLGDFLAQQLRMSNPVDRASPDIPALLPSSLASDVVLSPWRRNLVYPPVLDFTVEAPPRVRIMHWRFIITDDQGRIFRLIKGTRRLPDHISWDGLSDAGEPLRVGHPYAYSLSVLDRSGVPTYLSGKSVRMSSYVHQTSNRIAVSIAPEVLFDNGYELSAKGKDYMLEARDGLRAAWTRNISVHAYGVDADLARRQAETVQKYLESGLHLSPGKIGVHGHPLGKDKYVRIEVIAQ